MSSQRMKTKFVFFDADLGWAFVPIVWIKDASSNAATIIFFEWDFIFFGGLSKLQSKTVFMTIEFIHKKSIDRSTTRSCRLVSVNKK